jgi:nucleoside-diphosphate-sugar epimerase
VSAAVTGPRYEGAAAVVLGADGFVGRWVACSLTGVAADLHLVVLNREAARPMFDGYGVRGQVHEADLTDLRGTQSLLKELAPDIVFNLAGYGVAPAEKRDSDEDRAELLNARLPAAIAEALAARSAGRWGGRRIVHAGSVFEYGQIGGHLEESATPAPLGPYGTTKLQGTVRLRQACQAVGLQGVTARLCQLYGPGEHPGRLLPSLLAARGQEGPLILSVGTQRKDFTYVADVAEGLLRLGLSQGPPGEIVNLATGKLTTVREFATTAAHLLRLDPGTLRFEKPLPDNELEHEEVATDRLRGLIGWVPPTGVAEGIRQTVTFLDRAGHR